MNAEELLYDPGYYDVSSWDKLHYATIEVLLWFLYARLLIDLVSSPSTAFEHWYLGGLLSLFVFASFGWGPDGREYAGGALGGTYNDTYGIAMVIATVLGLGPVLELIPYISWWRLLEKQQHLINIGFGIASAGLLSTV